MAQEESVQLKKKMDAKTAKEMAEYKEQISSISKLKLTAVYPGYSEGIFLDFEKSSDRDAFVENFGGNFKHYQTAGYSSNSLYIVDKAELITFINKNTPAPSDRT